METQSKQYPLPFNRMFKSYYVVWKPYEVTEAKDGKYRLNRTMQYGNAIVTKDIQPRKKV